MAGKTWGGGMSFAHHLKGTLDRNWSFRVSLLFLKTTFLFTEAVGSLQQEVLAVSVCRSAPLFAPRLVPQEGIPSGRWEACCSLCKAWQAPGSTRPVSAVLSPHSASPGEAPCWHTWIRLSLQAKGCVVVISQKERIGVCLQAFAVVPCVR